MTAAPATVDRTYWHRLDSPTAWHAQDIYNPWVGFCGRKPGPVPENGWNREQADRVPPSAHLCGSCARVIAARTDIEPSRAAGLRALAADTQRTGLY